MPIPKPTPRLTLMVSVLELLFDAGAGAGFEVCWEELLDVELMVILVVEETEDVEEIDELEAVEITEIELDELELEELAGSSVMLKS